jgi:chaperonin GroEL
MNIKEILPVLEGLQSKGKTELVLMVEDISDDVMANLIVNKIKNVFNVCIIRTRNMEDIAVVTGAQIVSEEAGHKFTEEMLGWADKVETGKYSCLVSGGKEEQSVVDEKIEELKLQRENADNEYDKQVAAQRIAKLQGGVSLVKIAGDNEQQTKEMKLKLEDALNAVKSAMDEGVIEGGGMALYNISQAIRKSELDGEAVALVVEVIETPLKQILTNADEDVEMIEKGLEENVGKGYNVITREYEDFYKSGIIDPVKVVKCALKNAFAMGTSIMTAEAGIIVKKDK